MATEARETGNLIGKWRAPQSMVLAGIQSAIERVMIDKLSDKVSYAVLSFGGFLRIGDDHYPAPAAILEIRYKSRRLRYRHHGDAGAKCPEI